MSNKAWEEIGDMIYDGFTGTTYTANNLTNDTDLIFHTYKIGSETWLTIKESFVDDVDTVNIVGTALEELYDFIGKILNK